LTHNYPLLDRQPEAPPSPARFLALITDKLVATEEVFHRHLASDVPFIHQSGEYIFQGGGKRMRPALLLLVAQLLGHDGEEEVTYGAVIEFIHTATLIHDDIIDNATLRRGRRSPNHLWGNSRTVLLGDWLYTTAMQMALFHDNLEVIRELCSATLKMIEGELMALERLGATDLTTEEYFQIIDRKTADLFAAACYIPTLIHPRQPEIGEVLHRYGKSLGTCFQLVDDLLDFTGSEEKLGKPVLSDLKEGKLTLPLILLLPRLARADRRVIQNVLEDRGFVRSAPEQILELVEREGTREQVREMAEGFARQAQREVEAMPLCDAREALELAPEFVLNRSS
jgi:octaprenyl-diphosphate synthase